MQVAREVRSFSGAGNNWHAQLLTDQKYRSSFHDREARTRIRPFNPVVVSQQPEVKQQTNGAGGGCRPNDAYVAAEVGVHRDRRNQSSKPLRLARLRAVAAAPQIVARTRSCMALRGNAGGQGGLSAGYGTALVADFHRPRQRA